ncbi:sensor histidine kinase [Paenibacillus macquariensis]|uniref:histidine kinase n=1 Tax=Paenibacillus macquariensis TaxID=948756 RepID=A0ABY1KB53_9BACL|nr:HAMP domain-containing sensor histidine kinase [Paenibacillus macquariensis]MEC0089556.1 ATP-binding protein [Paenibacillus macquariensis]OAB25776.1 two-component sensor histidine kinase [Paenibacillus macquariensis subsp. macquariensis]SIR53661.1 two-component system, OmpR family, sensor kinase [Paenibacillus macquariensis]
MTKNWITRIKHLFVPRSLRFQLLTRSLLIMAVLLLLVGLLQYVVMKDFLYRKQAETMEAQMQSMPRDWFMRKSLDESRNKPLTRPGGNAFLFIPGSSLAWIDSNGISIDINESSGNVSPTLSTEEYKQILEKSNLHKKISYQIIQDTNGNEQLVVFRPLEAPNRSDSIVQMGTKTAPLQDQVMQQLLIFFSLSAIALIGGAALYLPLLLRTLLPLSNMVKSVEQTDVGNLAERFPVSHGQEEIDRLSVSFNGMLERLEISFESEKEAREQMRRFIADASHELRTPLTSIHGFLEVLLRGAAANPEQLTSALKSMYGESKRVNKLVEDLLLLAKMDRSPQLQLTEVNLGELIREMRPQLVILAGERTINLDLNYAIKGTYDPDKMKQVILNLFQNAVQHTDPKDGVITITLHTTGNRAELAIRDNGVGIHEEHLLHVFERFYRSDSSRTRKYGGAGLGLSITKSIVEAHGGSIHIESQHGTGTVFIVEIPISTRRSII